MFIEAKRTLWIIKCCISKTERLGNATYFPLSFKMPPNSSADFTSFAILLFQVRKSKTSCKLELYTKTRGRKDCRPECVDQARRLEVDKGRFPLQPYNIVPVTYRISLFPKHLALECN